MLDDILLFYTMRRLFAIQQLVLFLEFSSKRGDEYLFFPPDILEENEKIQEFYESYDAKRKARGLITKGVAPLKLKPFFTKRTYLTMKYGNLPMPANMAFCNDKMAVISWSDKPVGVLIKSKKIVEKQKEFFMSIWNAM